MFQNGSKKRRDQIEEVRRFLVVKEWDSKDSEGMGKNRYLCETKERKRKKMPPSEAAVLESELENLEKAAIK